MTTRAAHAETVRQAREAVFRAFGPTPGRTQAVYDALDAFARAVRHEAGADRLHPHEDGEDKGVCAHDHPSVISGPDQAAPTTEAGSDLLKRLRKAHDALCEAVQRQWDRKPAFRLSIPAQREADGDLMISDALIAAIEFVKQEIEFRAGGCLPNTPNKAASPSGGLSRASHQPETEVGSVSVSSGSEASGGTGRSASAIQHPQSPPPEDEQTDQARSGQGVGDRGRS